MYIKRTLPKIEELAPAIDPGEKDMIVTDFEECPECGAVLKEIWDNSGWDGIEGPTHWVCTGVECTECSYQDN